MHKREDKRAVADIIEKWYKQLGFPKAYDADFYRAIQETEVNADACIETYEDVGDGKRNLLFYLYFCEALQQKYARKGISDVILNDTLSDIVRWTDTWSGITGTLWLGETTWLKRHLEMKLFQLGRLQFSMGCVLEDISSVGLAKDDFVLEIHIPACGPMRHTDCVESVKTAKVFFQTYYPEYVYRNFTCYSWLLDFSLHNFLDANSNILQFQKMFRTGHRQKSDAILKYLFKWDTTRENIYAAVPTSGFSERVKKHILDGGDFYEVFGVLI